MLAERTDTHLALFQEDVEAAFFDSDAEMIDKVHFYLQHEEIRQRVARAGYEKVKLRLSRLGERNEEVPGSD